MTTLSQYHVILLGDRGTCVSGLRAVLGSAAGEN